MTAATGIDLARDKGLIKLAGEMGTWGRMRV